MRRATKQLTYTSSGKFRLLARTFATTYYLPSNELETNSTTFIRRRYDALQVNTSESYCCWLWFLSRTTRAYCKEFRKAMMGDFISCRVRLGHQQKLRSFFVSGTSLGYCLRNWKSITSRKCNLYENIGSAPLYESTMKSSKIDF